MDLTHSYGLPEPNPISRCTRSTHHFTDSAARWLQSVEPQLVNITWESFTSMILEHFNRD